MFCIPFWQIECVWCISDMQCKLFFKSYVIIRCHERYLKIRFLIIHLRTNRFYLTNLKTRATARIFLLQLHFLSLCLSCHHRINAGQQENYLPQDIIYHLQMPVCLYQLDVFIYFYSPIPEFMWQWQKHINFLIWTSFLPNLKLTSLKFMTQKEFMARKEKKKIISVYRHMYLSLEKHFWAVNKPISLAHLY